MDRDEHPSPTGRGGSLYRVAAGILAVVLLSGTAFAACSGAHDPATQAGAASAMPAMPTVTLPARAAMGAGDMVPTDASEAWAARPDFVRGNPQTEEAYAYALYSPQILQWMPCYCGCGGTGHRSNLDCYYKPAVPGRPTTFEEHASYCDVCVKTTLLAKQLIAEGKTLSEVRAAVDQTFGGLAPGTPTELPPA